MSDTEKTITEFEIREDFFGERKMRRKIALPE